MKTNEIIARSLAKKSHGEMSLTAWTQRKPYYMGNAKCVLTALSAAGLVVVPREPTEAMLIASDTAYDDAKFDALNGAEEQDITKLVYQAMIKAHEEDGR